PLAVLLLLQREAPDQRRPVAAPRRACRRFRRADRRRRRRLPPPGPARLAVSWKDLDASGVLRGDVDMGATRCQKCSRVVRWCGTAAVVTLTLGAFAPAAFAASAPPGYKVVIDFFSAPQSTFTTLAQTPCPTGTVTWGGGASFSAFSPP